MANKNIVKTLVAALLIIFFLLGVIVGWGVSSFMFVKSAGMIAGKLHIENINVGFNETYIMDRLNQTAHEVKWQKE